MSVVAVKIDKHKVELAADSFIGRGFVTQEKKPDAKIFQQNGMAVGAVGYAKDVEFFKMFTKTRQPGEATQEGMVSYLVEFFDFMKKKDGSYKVESDFIIVFKKKVFSLGSNLYVKEIKEYEAMGAGQDFALTALYMGKSAKEAVEVATELCIYCEKPVVSFSVKR